MTGALAAELIVADKRASETLKRFGEAAGVAEAKLKGLVTGTKTFGQTAAQTSAPVQKMGNELGNANLFMNQFAFTVQDAPFFFQNFRMGVMAVSNNLGFLTNQLGNVQREAKSLNMTMGATLMKTLTGPAGMVLAVSTAIAAVQALTFAMEEAEEQASNFEEALGILSGEQLGKVQANLNDQLTVYRGLLKETTEEVRTQGAQWDQTTTRVKAGQQGLNSFYKEQIERLEAQKEAVDKVTEQTLARERAERLVNELAGDQLGLYQALQRQAEELKKSLPAITDKDELRAAVDELDKINLQMEEMTKSTRERGEEEARLAKKRAEEEKRLADEERRRIGEHQAFQEEFVTSRMEALVMLHDAESAAVADVWDERKNRASQQYREQLEFISSLQDQSIITDEERSAIQELMAERLAGSFEQIDADKKKSDDRSLKKMSDLEEGALAVGQAFRGSGNDFLSILGQALQVAMQIVAAMAAGQGPLGIIGLGLGGLLSFFDEGGVVEGRRGAPRLVVAHAGETILPTHKMPMARALSQVSQTASRVSSHFDSGGVVSPQSGISLPSMDGMSLRVDMYNGRGWFRREKGRHDRIQKKRRLGRG